MQTMTKSWTDERLEERFDAIDHRFDSIERELGLLRLEIKTEFGAVRSEMKAEIGGLRGEISALQHTINRFGGGMILALLGLIATQL